jgi:hypothetical protein
MSKRLLGSVTAMMQSVGMQRRVPWLRRPGGLLEKRVAYGTGSRGERQKGMERQANQAQRVPAG